MMMDISYKGYGVTVYQIQKLLFSLAAQGNMWLITMFIMGIEKNGGPWNPVILWNSVT